MRDEMSDMEWRKWNDGDYVPMFRLLELLEQPQTQCKLTLQKFFKETIK